MNYSQDYLFAASLDREDPLRNFRNLFHLPKQKNGKPYLYFCGNSLGLQPRSTRRLLETELQDWEDLGVEGHLHAHNPWMPYHEFLAESTARLVGALPTEVVVMNSLSANLHFLLASFYRPTQQKFKIIIESDAFPSDAYIVESQLRFHGYSVEEGLIKLAPREGQICLMTEDILAVLEREKDCLALVLLGGVNYYTGQVFDMETIAASCQQYQLPLGLDLAHATGNVVLQLHDWGVDFAAWCSYKYLNAGPGAVGGAFIHEKHHANPDMPRLAGWWGHNKETRFQMKHGFEPIPTAEGWQVSNAPIFSMAALRASMEIFDQAGMDALREKSVKLTGYLAFMLGQVLKPEEMEIITPNTPEQRGCQISLRVKKNGKKLHKKLTEKGVICDWREPDVIRLAPVPLYNSFMDIWDFGNVVQAALQSVK